MSNEDLVLPDTEADLALRRQNLSNLIQAQVARKELEAQGVVGLEAFGAEWRAEESDWSALSAIADWVEANKDIRGLAARTPDRQSAAGRCEQIIVAREAWRKSLDILLSDLKATSEAAVTADLVMALQGEEVLSRLKAWQSGGEALTVWVG